MGADVEDCLRILDALEDIERRCALVRKEVEDLVLSLAVRYAQIRLSKRQRKLSARETKKFWKEERGDRLK